MITKTEREFVTELNANMPEFTGTPLEVQKKIAMYIYLKIGKLKVFDERWFLGNGKQRDKIERLASREKHDIDSLITKRKLVCITLSSLYNKVLKDFGINSSIAQISDEDIHYSNIITFQNGESIVVDLQRDLDRINTGSKTQNFGLKYENGELTGEKMSDDELFELHKSCGYVQNKDDYMDEKISQLAQKVGGMNSHQILEQIIMDENINNFPKDIGYIELYKYYTRIVQEIAPKLDKVKIHYFNCFRVISEENGNEEREYTMCMYSIDKEQINAYLYSNKEKMFKPVDLEKFAQLEMQGLHLGKNSQENGVKLLRKRMNKAKVEKENIK